jgi:succinyl-CoA synthetase alpha subunit
MIGEIGGTAEEEAAAWVKANMKQAGRGVHRRRDRASGQAHGPRGRDHQRRQGHQEALRAAGIAVAETPAEIGATLATAIGK